MAATFNWCEDNGAATSSHGTVQSGFGADTHYPTDVNWKSVDDNTVWNGSGSGTVYSAAPIQAGSFSMPKYQYGKLSGTYNQVSSGLFAHTAGTFGTGVTLKGGVLTTYTQPQSASQVSGTGDITSTTVISSGSAVLFSTTGPWGSTTSTLTSSATGYTQYLVTQLDTTTGASPGDTASITITLQYNEN